MYIGIPIDTVRRRVFLTQKKDDKLFNGTYEVLAAEPLSPSDLSKLHGKLITYIVHVQRLRPQIFAASLRAFNRALLSHQGPEI